MIEEIVHFLHIAPLILIISFIGGAISYKLFMKKSLIRAELLSATLLVLCSIGIISGHYVHHHEAIDLLDPCFGYGFTLMGIALQVARARLNADSNI